MERDPIVLVAYDSSWPAHFQAERARLADIFRDEAAIEHMGSTAVPGLAAKPVIDIMLGAESLAAIEQHIPELESLSYEYVPSFESVMPERRYFRRGQREKRTHQIHAVVRDGPFWKRHLAFRDYLRTHPETAREYVRLKTELARLHRGDREAYSDAKGPFVRSVERLAMNGGSGR
jgi:GrpB-like predicted nucleotidyltransferase (UPF0157 family)